jgi:hypothetical protein
MENKNLSKHKWINERMKIETDSKIYELTSEQSVCTSSSDSFDLPLFTQFEG